MESHDMHVHVVVEFYPLTAIFITIMFETS